MIQNHSLFLKNRQVTLTEFGYVTALDEHNESFKISSDNGKELEMRKMHHKWPHTIQKCRKSLAHGIRIVTRCGANMDEGSFFNEVYIDPNGAPLLAFPPDGEIAY